MCITYSERVPVNLVIQHAMCMRHIILSSVACLLILYFSTFSCKRNDSGERVTEYEARGMIFSTNFSGHVSHPKKNSARQAATTNVLRSSCEVPVIIVRFK